MKKSAAAVLLVLMTAGVATRAQGAGEVVEVEGYDLSALDATIAAAAERAQAQGASASDKRAAAAGYLARGNLLYNAAQPQLYRHALGDFRRALRFQPDLEEAREKAELITSIYQSLTRPVPTQGEAGDPYNDPRSRYKTKPEAVKFVGGDELTKYPRQLPAGVSYVYEIKLPAGRRFNLNLKTEDGGPARFDLHRAGAVVAANATRWEDAAPAAGTYLVRVSSAKEGVTYELEVRVW